MHCNRKGLATRKGAWGAETGLGCLGMKPETSHLWGH